MLKEDKLWKPNKNLYLKFSKDEKNALKALGHMPKFPKKLEGIKNHNKH